MFESVNGIFDASVKIRTSSHLTNYEQISDREHSVDRCRCRCTSFEFREGSSEIEHESRNLTTLASRHELGDDRVRAIVRFDYARGDEVARLLKAALVKAATSRAPRIPGSPPRRRTVPLRVRLDDQEPFDDPGGAPPGARAATMPCRTSGPVPRRRAMVRRTE